VLRANGIRRIDGRLIGDDTQFDDQGLGAGWAWDYLGSGYAAKSGALSYNENAVTLTLTPGSAAGDPVRLQSDPSGDELDIINHVRTGPAGTVVDLELFRAPATSRLLVQGGVPAGSAAVTRTAAVESPTRFFLESFRTALERHGIVAAGGTWAITQARDVPSSTRTLHVHESAPLSELAAYFMKASQNFYAEMLLKTLGRSTSAPGTAETGRKIVRDVLVSWGIPPDGFVVYDGSGLSRYNYVTASAVATILRRMWNDPDSRGRFAAALPVGGHDGTLDDRMKSPPLDARVQAKTGTIANVRALSGYLEGRSGNRLLFSMIANHFTAPNAQVDAVMERALTRLAEKN